MESSTRRQGYCIRTYRLILECGHPEWLLENQKLYHEIQRFYYEVLLRHQELLDLGNQQILRELERLTVSSRGNPIRRSLCPGRRCPLISGGPPSTPQWEG